MSVDSQTRLASDDLTLEREFGAKASVAATVLVDRLLNEERVGGVLICWRKPGGHFFFV